MSVSPKGDAPITSREWCDGRAACARRLRLRGPVFAPYRSILALPGAKAFTSWGLLARAQMAMTELGILLMVQIEYGSYAVAGRVVAVVAISWASRQWSGASSTGSGRRRRSDGALASRSSVASPWSPRH